MPWPFVERRPEWMDALEARINVIIEDLAKKADERSSGKESDGSDRAAEG